MTPGYSLDDGLTIELAGKQAPRQRAPLANGNFSFHAVPAGSYQFRVLDRGGKVLFRRAKSLTGANDHVIITAPFKRSNAQVFANTISFRALRSQALRQARDAFQAAEKAMDAGEAAKSLQYLQKALAIDPQFAEAHVNLAAQYVQLGRAQEAMHHFQAAFDLGPKFPEAAYDYAMLLVLTARYPQAELVARRALGSQENSPGLRGILAASLIWQERNLEEAYNHLRLAAPAFPVARLLAANALVSTRRFKAAEAQVTEYLQTAAHPCERKELENWLARLGAAPPVVVDGQD